jgi:hypothetical protein
MALGSTQPLTEMNTRNILWGKGGRRVGLTTLPPSCADCPEKWEPQPPGTLRACPGFALPLQYHRLIRRRMSCAVTRASRKPLNLFFIYFFLLTPHCKLYDVCSDFYRSSRPTLN